MSWSKDVEAFAEKVKSSFPVEAILIFGSYAKNQHGDWSDIDILVLSDRFKDVNILDRFKILQEFKVGRIEAFAYTYEELVRMVDKGNPLALNALSEGKPLIVSPRVEKLVSLVREKYVKKGKAWIFK